ncbi:hypothetical protein FRC09_004687 [Ceratobasidium sp. 395]|nr:hypothetical protein FRC09_004687 [Ceratobasidium sp. 395]
MRNAMIVTNMWTTPADPEEGRRYEQLMTGLFKVALSHGARMYQQGEVGLQPAQAIVRMMINLPPIELLLQTELIRGFSLDKTKAGKIIGQHLRSKLEEQRQEMGELEVEIQAAREDKDTRAQKQLERYKRDREEGESRLQEQIELLKASRWRLNTSAPQSNLRDPSRLTQGFPGGNDRRSGGFSKWIPKVLQPRAPLAGSRGRDPRDKRGPPPRSKGLSTRLSQNDLAVGTSADPGTLDFDPQCPHMVNGTVILLNRGAAADIWLAETPESKVKLLV